MIMENAPEATVETAIHPINVEYQGTSKEHVLFQIDPEKLQSAIKEVGYPPQIVKNIIISSKDSLNSTTSFAETDPLSKNILIHEGSLVTQMIRFYKWTLQSLGEEGHQAKNRDFFQKVIDSPIFQKLFPGNWSYVLAGIKEVPFITNPKRRTQYIKQAKEGTLSSTMSIEEQRARAKKFLEKQMIFSFKKMMGWIIAHETEHFNNRLKKKAIPIVLAAFSIALGTTLINAVDKLNLDNPSNDIKSSLALGTMALILFSHTKGASLDEKKSFEEGDKNFQEFTKALIINAEVFKEKIFNNQTGLDTKN